MAREIAEPTIDDYGNENHPAFGRITVTKSQGTPRTLFQTDLLHSHTVHLSVETATRARSLGRDSVFGRKEIVDIEMSLSQWAQLVASIGDGAGTPVTLRRTHEGRTPDLPYAPRTMQSRTEVENAVAALIAKANAAMDALDALEESKASVKERRAARSYLRSVLNNAPEDAKFATEQLERAAEHIVSQARADIETVVAEAAARHGLDSGPQFLPAGTDVHATPALPAPQEH